MRAAFLFFCFIQATAYSVDRCNVIFPRLLEQARLLKSQGIVKQNRREILEGFLANTKTQYPAQTPPTDSQFFKKLSFGRAGILVGESTVAPKELEGHIILFHAENQPNPSYGTIVNVTPNRIEVFDERENKLHQIILFDHSNFWYEFQADLNLPPIPKRRLAKLKELLEGMSFDWDVDPQRDYQKVLGFFTQVEAPKEIGAFEIEAIVSGRKSLFSIGEGDSGFLSTILKERESRKLTITDIHGVDKAYPTIGKRKDNFSFQNALIKRFPENYHSQRFENIDIRTQVGTRIKFDEMVSSNALSYVLLMSPKGAQRAIFERLIEHANPGAILRSVPGDLTLIQETLEKLKVEGRITSYEVQNQILYVKFR